MNLTNAQRVALDTLKAMRPFPITPERTMITRHMRRRIQIPAIIETGINSTTLWSLHRLGLIKAETIYARGHVTPDLVITGEGERA